MHDVGIRRDRVVLVSVSIPVVVRDGKAIYQRDRDFAFRPGDIVVAVGDRDSLARASICGIVADFLEGLDGAPPA